MVRCQPDFRESGIDNTVPQPQKEKPLKRCFS